MIIKLDSMHAPSLVTLLVIAYVVVRQLQPKEIDTDSKGALVILALGAWNMVQAIQAGSFPLTVAHLVALVVVLVVVAGGFAYARARSCKVWIQDGKVWRQGTWVTIAIWAVMIALHAVADRLIPGLSMSMLCYIGVSLATQQWITVQRAKELR